MAVAAYTADSSVLLLQEQRELHGKPWRFSLSIDRDFWEDIFDQIDHSDSPKDSAAAYKRDVPFWNWLATQGADAAAQHAVAGAASRTVQLAVPAGDPKAVYDRFNQMRRREWQGLV